MSTPDLNLRHLALNGLPVECGACGNPAQLTLDRSGPRETWPAWIGCGGCGHGEDHQIITNGLVAAAIDARTGRQRAEDRDTFAAEWRGLVLVGECVPEWTWDDVAVVRQALRRVVRTEVADRKRTARRWWGGQKRAARTAVRRAAGQATGAVTSRALAAAWDLQTGGADGSPKRRRCTVNGCRSGWLTITTRVHADTGAAEEQRVPCAVCRRA